MYRRAPRPTETDVHDDRRELAEALYADALSAAKNGDKPEPAVLAALDWIGYPSWVLPNNGFTPPTTPRRREKLFRELGAKPYARACREAVEAVGWKPAPARQAEKRFEHLDRYVEVDGDVVEWGLEDSLERDLIFHMRYDIVRLRVVDGGETVAEITRRPKQDGWGFVESFEELGLTDDDYRFEFHCLNSAGGARSRHSFDYAEVGGEWKRLKYQGYDWGGEWEGSQRTHEEVLRNTPPKPEPKPEPKVEPNPKLLREARSNFARRHSTQGGGADWYMTLVAYGDNPAWLAGTPAPESTDIVKHLRARAKLWPGWHRWVDDLERIGA